VGLATMNGGAGTDVFGVDNTGDVVNVTAASTTDLINSSVSYVLPVNVERLTLSGSTPLSATGNGLSDTLTAGGSGADTLYSGTGADSLVGGTGNDIFVVSSTLDTVNGGTSHGTDTIESSVSYSAPATILDLMLTGSASINGTGSSLAGGMVIGNSGTDVLTAVGASATLVGGAGNDTFTINNTSDVIVDTYTNTTNSLSSSVSYTLPVNVTLMSVTGTAAVLAVANAAATANDSITANTGADTLVGGGGTDTLVSGTGTDSLVAGSGTDVFVVNKTSDVVTVAATGTSTSDVIESSVTYSLAANVQYLSMIGTGSVTATGNSLLDLIVGNTGADTLNGGTGIAMIEGGSATTSTGVLKATGNQAALIGGHGAESITGGAFKDFLAAGPAADTITSGATANVIAVNKGDGATIIMPTTNASDVLSLGAGIDTESLTFTKSGNNLILNDGVTGDSITFENWYVGTADQDVKTLQVVEQASSSYNASGSNALQNKPLEEFNFTALVTAFNSGTAGWALSNDMSAAALTSSSTSAYGGDLGYYFGLNGNLTGMDLSAAQATLTNSSYATALQTIDAWSSISGGSGIHALAVTPTQALPISETRQAMQTTQRFVDPVQLAWMSADAGTPMSTALSGSEADIASGYETAPTLLGGAGSAPLHRTIDNPRALGVTT
jgi:Ca2+-binding RTX toxin-like protein